ncbi:MAG: hypothetical protein HN368_08725, partial [Spirochaetales bacterium]|nr:hypothetical protein [Spirochaetales bacterium]
GKTADQEKPILEPFYPAARPKAPAAHSALVKKANAVSSAYIRAAGDADIQARRYKVYADLDAAASPRTLRDMERAVAAAALSLTGQENALIDRAWDLIQQFQVIGGGVDLGEKRLEVAEMRMAEKRRGFDFGIITDSEIAEYTLSYEHDIEAQRSRELELFLHFLKVLAFTGEDPYTAVTTQ